MAKKAHKVKPPTVLKEADIKNKVDKQTAQSAENEVDAPKPPTTMEGRSFSEMHMEESEAHQDFAGETTTADHHPEETEHSGMAPEKPEVEINDPNEVGTHEIAEPVVPDANLTKALNELPPMQPTIEDLYAKEGSDDPGPETGRSFTGETPKMIPSGMFEALGPGSSPEFPGNDAVTKAIEKLKREAKSRAERDKALVKYFWPPIMNGWGKCTIVILDLAKWCASARSNLDETQLKQMMKLQQFGKSTFSKLCKIGESERIQRLAGDLPPSYSIMYEVAKLTNDQWKRLEAKGKAVVNENLTRAMVQKYAYEGSGSSKPAKRRGGVGFVFASIILTAKELPEDAMATLREKLTEIGEIADVKVQYQDKE